MLADGGECGSDLGAVRDQQVLFGSVASTRRRFGSSTESRPSRGCSTRCARRTRGRAGARERFLEASWRAGGARAVEQVRDALRRSFTMP
jgi:hypothetical protein